MPGALNVVTPMAKEHDDGKNLLIAYSVAPLCCRHALRPKDNQMPIAFVGGCPDARGAVRAIAGVILLLRDNTSYGKTRGVLLVKDWPSRIEVCEHQGLYKGIEELCK